MKHFIKIMHVEGSRKYREGIQFALDNEEDMKLIGQFGTVESALDSLRDSSTRQVPDLILLDLRLPGMGGLDAIPRFAESMPEAKIMILSQSDQHADVLRAIALGAAGYLLKSSTLARIKEAIRTVVAGGASLDPGVANFLLHSLRSRLPKEDVVNLRSKREIEVLSHLGEGLSQKEIAERLGISPLTVDSHVRHIYGKLKVHNAPAAVNVAHRLGLFPVG